MTFKICHCNLEQIGVYSAWCRGYTYDSYTSEQLIHLYWKPQILHSAPECPQQVLEQWHACVFVVIMQNTHRILGWIINYLNNKSHLVKRLEPLTSDSVISHDMLNFIITMFHSHKQLCNTVKYTDIIIGAPK